MATDRWIQDATTPEKRGSLHRMLGINEDMKIPKSLLREIMRAEIGDTIRNPTTVGNRLIKVTKLLKQRANLALTFKSFKR